MSFMPYVSPDQMMKDRSEYAHKGIARGRAGRRHRVRATGILFVAENPSTTLHKISEIYDRIAFAGVGKYNEFEDLRIAGVRHADLQRLLLQPRGRQGARASPTPTRRSLGDDLHPAR